MSQSTEKGTTFHEFIAQLQHWVDAQEMGPLVDFLCMSDPHRPPISVPTLKKLWSAYLREILPRQYADVVFAESSRDGDDHHPLIHRLTELSEYTPEHRFIGVLQQTILRFLSTKGFKYVIELLFNFHRQSDQWQDGTWHRLLADQHPDGFKQIKKRLLFESDWQCARFIRNCGYPIQSSEAGFCGWLKFSGKEEEPKGYQAWKDNLSSLNLPAAETLKVDYFMDVLFSDSVKLDLPTLCRSRASCTICPLSDSCRFYQLNYSTDINHQTENQIRSEGGPEIPTDQLIKYVLHQSWDGSEYHTDCLDRFPDLKVKHLIRKSHDTDQEPFAISLLAIQELVRREYVKTPVKEGGFFTNSRAIVNHYHYLLSESSQESVHILILDNKHRVLKRCETSLGTLNQSLVHPREVFAPAIQLRAAAIVVIHNHPSGDPQPSKQDFATTKRLVGVGELVGINVLDHIIIGKDNYFSFLDEGVLP